MKQIFITGICILGIFSGCISNKPVLPEGTITPQEEFPKKTYKCNFTSQPVKLDGKLDDPVWKKAEKLWGFTRYPYLEWSRQPEARKYAEARREPAESRTEVMMLWDEKYLYVGAKLYDKDLFSLLKKHDAMLCYDDVFEIFYRPSLKSHEYYELHVNPNNANLDIFYWRRFAGFAGEMKYSSNMKSAVQLKGTLNNPDDVDEYWTLEVKIPFAGVNFTGGKPPKPGDKWTFTVCRYDYSVHLPGNFVSGRELSSSAANLTFPGYHDIEAYDYLEFVK